MAESAVELESTMPRIMPSAASSAVAPCTDLARRPKPPRLSDRGLQVTVCRLDGAMLEVVVCLRDRVRQLKSQLANLIDMHHEEMQLMFGDQVLRDSDRIHGCVAQGASVFTLVRVPRISTFLQNKGLSDVNCLGSDGSTVLHLAVSQCDERLCFEILAHKDFTLVDQADFLGSTALHRAAEKQLSRVCAGILGHQDFQGAVNAVNRNGNTALHLAALRGDANTCAAILGDPDFHSGDLSNSAGRTPADLAADAGHEEVADYLRRATAEFHDNSSSDDAQFQQAEVCHSSGSADVAVKPLDRVLRNSPSALVA